jgi:hypothetical protein
MGMDDASKLDTRLEKEPETDRCLLLFSPAPPELDAVIKQTSETAAYRHEFASQQGLPAAAATS